MKKELLSWAGKRGLRAAALSPGALDDARGLIRGLRAAGGFDRAFFEKEIDGLLSRRPQDVRSYKSIILLAMPRPAHRLRFETDRGSFDALMPSTYLDYRKTFDRILGEFLDAMGFRPSGFRLLQAPLKTLARLAGLASYGRNNIAYVPGIGSYLQLIGILSKRAVEPFLDADRPAEPILASCAECTSCLVQCPTGAIGKDRFLIRADKCLTLFNESKGRIPKVQDKLARHPLCLVGCLVCQAVCPANRGKLKIEDAPVRFSGTETERIIQDKGGRADGLWKAVHEKMEAIGNTHYEPVLGRNLRFVMGIGPGH